MLSQINRLFYIEESKARLEIKLFSISLTSSSMSLTKAVRNMKYSLANAETARSPLETG